MRLIISNTSTQVITGGKDNLLPFDLDLTIREYLRVRPNGYNFNPAYRRRKKGGERAWDGYKYFITPKGQMGTGFLALLLPYMRELGVDVEIVDERKNMPEIRKVFDGSLSEWDMRDYQEDHTKKVMTSVLEHDGGKLWFPRGIIEAATNAGKNSVIAGAIKNVVEPRCLLLIHRKEIYDQHVKFLSPMFDVGEIRSGVLRIKPVTIAMWETLAANVKARNMNVMRALKTYFNMLVVDECHRAGGKDYSQLIQEVDAGMRIFVSGTPLDNESKVSNMVIVGLSGKVVAKISKKELMDKGFSLPVKVTFHLNPLNGYDEGDKDYEKIREDRILFNEERVELIADILAQGKKKTLITFIELEHGEFMYLKLSRHPKLKGRKIEWIYGQDKQRKEKKEKFTTGEIEILICSSIFQEGINVPDINRLIYAQGEKAKIPLSQWSGRIERHDGVSDHVELHDFWDEGEHVSDHSNKRKIFYKKEQFDIKYTYEQKYGKPTGTKGKTNTRSRLDQARKSRGLFD